MKKKALIFGISGQDGSYLAKLLIQKTILYLEPQDRKSNTLKILRS